MSAKKGIKKFIQSLKNHLVLLESLLWCTSHAKTTVFHFFGSTIIQYSEFLCSWVWDSFSNEVQCGHEYTYIASITYWLCLLVKIWFWLSLKLLIQPTLGKLSYTVFYCSYDMVCILAEILGTVQWTRIKRETGAANLDWKLKCNLRNINNRNLLKSEFWL